MCVCDNGGAFPSDLSVLSGKHLAYAEHLSTSFARYSPTGNTVCDWDFVTGLDATAPPGWIIAYGDPKWFNGQGGPILYVDGSVKLCDRRTFDQEMQKFLADYARARGSPPTIVPAR
jgi:hypothetical protein